ncbi:uncharacterized protein LOC143035655 [Oratosquilla oratoria]|uniref:uncharacterized protein LOC143035655 n=1 Tax=Oratosquilla oratoria TaxID=337810 RepID=UPI003F7767EF
MVYRHQPSLWKPEDRPKNLVLYNLSQPLPVLRLPPSLFTTWAKNKQLNTIRPRSISCPTPNTPSISLMDRTANTSSETPLSRPIREPPPLTSRFQCLWPSSMETR